jgi:hypothetical protein
LLPFMSWLWLIVPSGAQTPPPACAIEIVTPRSGASVPGELQIQGKAAIPPGTHLWVFAHRKGLALWWPQGGGATTVVDGMWDTTVFLGEPRDIGRPFEIVAIAVEANADASLRAWVARAEETGRYPGMRFPQAVSTCRLATITVIKTE